MFREELEDLKNRYLGRLSVLHVLESRGAGDRPVHRPHRRGEVRGAVRRTGSICASVDTAFICGPEPMMLAIAGALKEHGLADSADQVRAVRLGPARPRPSKRAAEHRRRHLELDAEATVTLDGATRTFRMPKEGTSLLDAALAASLDAPYACKAGVCSTCRAKVLEGEVEMAVNYALEDYEVRAGYVLTCQCYPAQRQGRRRLRPVREKMPMTPRRCRSRTISPRAASLTAPANAPARYRGELMRLMAAFVDSELAASAGFADTINVAPGITERIAAARITLEKADHAERVLEHHGRLRRRHRRATPATTPGPTACRATPTLGQARHGGDMRLAVFHYPIQGWTDAVVMNVLQGLATGVQLEELARVSYAPLAEVFRAIAPRERRHAELGHRRPRARSPPPRKAAPRHGPRSPTGSPRSPTASAPPTPPGSRR